MPGIDDCLKRAMNIQGALGASLVDYTTGLALGTLGDRPYGDDTVAATGTADVVRAALQSAAYAPPAVTAGEGTDVMEDVVITTGRTYHLLRMIRTSFDSRLVFHLWLDRGEGNLAIAQRRVRMLAEDLV